MSDSDNGAKNGAPKHIGFSFPVRPAGPRSTRQPDEESDHSVAAEVEIPDLHVDVESWLARIIIEIREAMHASGVIKLNLTLEDAGASHACHVDWEVTAVQGGSIDLK